MTGIICAMDIESRLIRENLRNRRMKEISGIKYYTGTFEGNKVVVATCGIGKVSAAICAQTMILEYKPQCIINTGVAGTLTEDLSIGDIAISTDAVQHDMDTSAIGDPVGLISGINIIKIPADPEITEQFYRAAGKAGIKAVKGTVASGDVFVADKSRKQFIKQTFGGIACEMEGAAIAQTAYLSSVPFCILRAISDSADGKAHMNYSDFTGMAAENSVKVLKEYFRLTEQ